MRSQPLLLALAACASGCFSDHGLAIEVDVGATGATAVELYLGQPCNASSNPGGIDCQSIQPPGSSGALPGTVWFRDADARYFAEVHGGKASFRLRVDTQTTVPLILAVGLAPGSADADQAVATQSLRDVVVPIDSEDARVIETALAAAGPIAGDTPPGAVDRAAVWTKQSPASSCVAVEHWQNGAATRDFIVPADDPDCDDVAPECNPSAYHGGEPGGAADTPRCFADTGADPGSCLLGSLGCRDDAGITADSCAPLIGQHVCVPQRFCTCNAANGPDQGCLADAYDNPSSTMDDMPRIECTVPMKGLLDLCPDRASATINLDRFYPDARCRQPRIGSLAFTDLDTEHEFGGAVLELESPHDPCNFEINWKRGTRTSASPVERGVIELSTHNGTILVPLILRFFQNTCVAAPLDAFHCDLGGDGSNGINDGDDPLWQCAP